MAATDWVEFTAPRVGVFSSQLLPARAAFLIVRHAYATERIVGMYACSATSITNSHESPGSVVWNSRADSSDAKTWNNMGYCLTWNAFVQTRLHVKVQTSLEYI